MLLRIGFAQTTLRYGLRLVHPVTYNRKPVHKPRSKEKRDLGYEVTSMITIMMMMMMMMMMTIS